MTRQEIIKIIEMCYEVGQDCTECPLFSEDDCDDKLMHNVLAFLKEQEAKTPVEYEHNGYWYYVCPTCGNHEELFREWNYCPFCGQEVKWD